MKVETRERDPWEIREDVRHLKEANAIKGDPNRLKDAQEYIRKDRQAEDSVLGLKSAPAVPGRQNPATIMKLNVKN